ncbi:hypothetical protein LY78DRAFT_352958 [Colletotrichum sublineola]|nr:hypothetical protein LY78DRAFT_352958 [Colletotrichum sublineola]
MATKYSSQSSSKHPPFPRKARSMFNRMDCTPEVVEAAEILMEMQTKSWGIADYSCPHSSQPLETMALGHSPSPPSSSMTQPDARVRTSPTVYASGLSSTVNHDSPTKKRKTMKPAQEVAVRTPPEAGQPISGPHSKKSKKVSCSCSRKSCVKGIKVAPSTMDGHLRAEQIKQKGEILDPPCSTCANSNRPCYKWIYISCETCSRRKEPCSLNDKKSAVGTRGPT